MADKFLTIDARLDTKVLESQYRQVQSEAEKLRRKLSDTDRADIATGLAENLQSAESELKDTQAYIDELRQKLQALKDEQTANPFVFQAGSGPDQMASIEGKLAEATTAADGYRTEIDKANEAIQKHQQEVADLQRRIASLDGYAERYADTVNDLDAGGLEDAGNAAEDGASGANQFATAVSKVGNRIAGLAKRVFFFSLVARGFRALVDYAKKAFTANTKLAQSYANLKAAAATAAQPLLNALAPAVLWLINLFTTLFTAIANVTALLTHTTVKANYSAAKAINTAGTAASGTADSMEEQAEAEEDASGGLLDFDKINTLATDDDKDKTPSTDSGGGGGGGSGVSFGDMDTSPAENQSKVLELLGRAWEALGRIIAVVGKALKYFWDTVGKPVADALGGLFIAILEKVVGWLEKLADWAEAHQDDISQWVTLVLSFVVPVLAVMAAINGVKKAVEILGPVFSKFGTFLTSPLGIFIAIVAALAAIVVATGHGAEAIDLFKSTVVAFINGITALIQGDTEAAKTYFMTALNGLADFVQLVLTSISEFISMVLTAIFGDNCTLVNDIITIITDLLGVISALIEAFQTGNWTIFMDALKTLGSDCLTFLYDTFMAIVGLIGAALAAAWAFLTTWFANLGTTIKNWFAARWADFVAWVGNISNKFSSTVAGVKAMLFGALVAIETRWTNFWQGLRRCALNALNGVIGGAEGFINFFINGLNGLIDKVNSISFDLPAIMGGGHIGFSLGHLGGVSLPRIPAYASGAVLPGGKPHLAWLGDQPAGQTNVEAPAALIKQMVAEALSEYTPVVQNNIQLKVSGSIEKIARALIPALTEEEKRKGSKLQIEL